VSLRALRVSVVKKNHGAHRVHRGSRRIQREIQVIAKIIRKPHSAQRSYCCSKLEACSVQLLAR
jgi:hypothetical protein